ncbi:MAG: transaldolase [Candidatus Omnitrophica bacterium]|nr:transaldolase [Candidatus Omnitrophota bacterium]
MSKTRMQELGDLGQSLWLDNISRSMIEQGKLKGLIDQGLRGQTSNPTIFKQAISQSTDYDAKIVEMTGAGKSTFEIYDDLTIRDVRDACDLFKGVYESTNALDGYVSLEINPHLANTYEEQRDEGLRLWQKVNRPNLMIKVPGTRNGCRAFSDLLAKGVNVNVTLIFSAEQYQDVAWAYLNGMKRLSETTKDLSRVRSVASVFVSRIDTTIDKTLSDKAAATTDAALRAKYEGLQGRAAVANSEIIFHKYGQLFAGPEFKALEAFGAKTQRVLWASTGTKNPKYSDIKYITELIAKPTVNTVPDKTLEAFIDHGVNKIAMPGDVAGAQKTIQDLRAEGIDVGVVCLKLLEDGLVSFDQSFDELTQSIEEKAKRLTVR